MSTTRTHEYVESAQLALDSVLRALYEEPHLAARPAVHAQCERVHDVAVELMRIVNTVRSDLQHERKRGEHQREYEPSSR